MLESLCKGHGNIHEMNVAGAFPERAPYQPRELYEALKGTPLYDAEREQWNSSMSERQVLANTHRNAYAQLLGVLVEAEFDPQGALAMYEKLKGTPLYDPECGQWNWYMSEGQVLSDTHRNAYVELVGVLVEAEFNSQAGRALYERLQGTPLYDAERGQRNWFMSEGQELKATGRYAYTQLLGVLVEAKVSPKAARAMYEKLKGTALYDQERGQWNWYMSEGQVLKNTARYAHTQLLGVLVEAEFNPQGAQAMYEKLKGTALYDQERRQWNSDMSEGQELKDTSRYASVQLIGVLVEARLLPAVCRPLVQGTPPLPVTEDW